MVSNYLCMVRLAQNSFTLLTGLLRSVAGNSDTLHMDDRQYDSVFHK